MLRTSLNFQINSDIGFWCRLLIEVPARGCCLSTETQIGDIRVRLYNALQVVGPRTAQISCGNDAANPRRIYVVGDSLPI
jgi:hypothetical protein